MFNHYFQGRRVFVTGHTGFKGSWLVLWLKQLGAEVHGFSLPPPTEPSLFDLAGVKNALQSDVRGDVRDAAALAEALQKAKPEVVLHLAAQPLVRESYETPVETVMTNVMGTVHLLEAVRRTPSVKVCEIITTDKVYQNREWVHPYRENDALGGADPYSASKGMAEIAVASWRHSFFPPERLGEHGVSISSARAGNVIGGGDFAKDRILPDCYRSLAAGQKIPVRNPHSQRPWQHVLEPLSGYLWLAAHQAQDGARYAEAWNFGPYAIDAWNVGRVVERFTQAWGSGTWQHPSGSGPHEAKLLQLDIAKAQTLLQWRPVWDCGQAIDASAAWYKASTRSGFDAHAFCLRQIAAFEERAEVLDVAWTKV